MRKTFSIAIACMAVLLLASCATVYQRSWTYESSTVQDSLTLSGDSFQLVRTSAGEQTFSGKFSDQGEKWVFDVTMYRATNGAVKSFEPPVRYVYSVKKFPQGVSFLAIDKVEGGSVGANFIQKGDFTQK
jgi:hypothetical protein